MSTFTHRLITADRMDLGPEHDRREDQKEETLEAEEDEEDDSCWWRKITALWGEEATPSQSVHKYGCQTLITDSESSLQQSRGGLF